MPAVDTAPGASSGVAGPAANAVAVTPNDTTDLGFVTRAIFCGGAGTIAVNMAATGANVSFTVAAGQILPIRVARILATGTSATNVVALW